jgi:hypothetical protein
VRPVRQLPRDRPIRLRHTQRAEVLGMLIYRGTVANSSRSQGTDVGVATTMRATTEMTLPRTFAELHALINRLVATEDTHGNQR